MTDKKAVMVVEVYETPPMLDGKPFEELKETFAELDWKKIKFKTLQTVEIPFDTEGDSDIQRLAEVMPDALQVHMNISVMVEGEKVREAEIHGLNNAAEALENEDAEVTEADIKRSMAESIFMGLAESESAGADILEALEALVALRSLRRIRRRLSLMALLDEIFED